MSALEATPRWIIGHSAGAALGAQYALDTDTLPKGMLCINAAFNLFGSVAAPLFSKTKWFARSQWLPRCWLACASLASHRFDAGGHWLGGGSAHESLL